jgi:hypothetical protein
MKNHVYLAAALSLSCATPDQLDAHRIEPLVADAANPPSAPDPVAIPTAEQLDEQIAARMAQIAEEQRAATAALPSVTQAESPPTETAVQRALNGYGECYSELRSVRRHCRARFVRTLSETTLIRRMGNEPGLLEATQTVLGRIILSEANWLHDERRDRFFPEQNHAERDAPGIYAVLRRTRRSGETLLGAMRRHAPHVSEARPITGRLTGRRMAWIVRLQMDCDRPHGFPETDRAGNPIDWDDDGYRERCENLFAYAGRLLSGEESLGVWETAPVTTWGGRCEDEGGACDDHLGSHRGLVPWEPPSGPLPANRFWCRPGTDGCDGPPLAVGGASSSSAPESAR